ncbi:uncharacterized protein LOC131694798 [Topomyia yanbarensis]|uniref:uncharacterized protein LOC131694798 n=1 Tax=Topomyia yanbarensis TaxID=2498891 RepID=UPI00273AC4B1|nr:uncharacterized protein LOC131694798 [Topomyia yanbarensis]
MLKDESVSSEHEEEFLKKNKEHLLETLAQLMQSAKDYKNGKNTELIDTWAERLEEIAKEYRRVVCVLEMHGGCYREERAEFENKYCALRAFYTKQIKDNHAQSAHTVHVRQLSHIRYPELNLPRFTGKLEDWCVFRDAFESAIGNREEVANIDKFQYLKGLVHGEAARIIEAISVCDEGYNDAWRALKLRYENKRQLVRCHIKALFDTPAMKRETADELLGLVDKFEQHISVLRRLGEGTDAWSSMLVYQLSIRLDSHTLREWENYCARLDSDNVAAVLGGTADPIFEDCDDTMPSYISMVNFLQNYARVLQSVGPSSLAGREREPKPKPPVKFGAHISCSSTKLGPQSTRKCEQCNQDHSLYQCPQFQRLSDQQRLEVVRFKKLCLNCLRHVDHFAKNCPWKSCNRCPRKHHSLLHGAQFTQQTPSAPQPNGTVTLVAQPTAVESTHTSTAALQPSSAQFHSTQPPKATRNPATMQPFSLPGNFHYATVACDKENQQNTVILPTALVEVEDIGGRRITARCLLDSGSQSHFITRALCQKLKLPCSSAPSPILVSGIGQTTTKATQFVTAKVSSRVSPFTIEPRLLILPHLAITLPSSTINIRGWHIPEAVQLADPTFHLSKQIDIILGAEYFFNTLRYGRIQLGEQLPILQNSALGWFVSGACVISDHDHTDPRSCFSSSTVRLEELLRKFWELETVRDSKGWSPTDRICEEHCIANTSRTPESRYMVKLPEREELIILLGDNKYQATRRFLSLERSLQQDLERMAMYKDFIDQYISLGHMREVSPQELEVRPQFILPHHGVLKLDSSTTKLRTVFDASCKSRSGLALNDTLLPGPTIQDTLVALVLRFRIHRYVVSADIEKMFRQVLVHPSDQPLQRILWRGDPRDSLKLYQLQTVTYGLNNSPFLATRVLLQLAEDEKMKFPVAARIAKKDFYVDNLLTGANDTLELQRICKQMICLLNAGGFPLRQWSANSQEVLNIVPENLRETRTLLELDRDSSITALGLRWEPAADTLSFKPPKWKGNQQLTKRTVLSQMSSLFDPLGLVGPSIVRAKIIMQSLWKHQLDWDAPLPSQYAQEWNNYQLDIPCLENLRVPRAAILFPHHDLQIHGFSDASEQAYGACLYLRSINASGQCSVQLLTAKSRVAPVDSKSIPRLELSAALLLTHLLVQVTASTGISIPTYLWTDSTVVLS